MLTSPQNSSAAPVLFGVGYSVGGGVRLKDADNVLIDITAHDLTTGEVYEVAKTIEEFTAPGAYFECDGELMQYILGRRDALNVVGILFDTGIRYLEFDDMFILLLVRASSPRLVRTVHRLQLRG